MSEPTGILGEMADALGAGPEAWKAFSEKMSKREKADRTMKTARTYLRKSVPAAREDPYRATQIAHELLEEMRRFVEQLPDEFYDPEDYTFKWALDEAEAIVKKLNAGLGRADLRRKIEALEDPTGRTPEEAALFAAKAQQLRAKLNEKGVPEWNDS